MRIYDFNSVGRLVPIPPKHLHGSSRIASRRLRYREMVRRGFNRTRVNLRLYKGAFHRIIRDKWLTGPAWRRRAL